jgi:hypothetical protein
LDEIRGEIWHFPITAQSPLLGLAFSMFLIFNIFLKIAENSVKTCHTIATILIEFVPAQRNPVKSSAGVVLTNVPIKLTKKPCADRMAKDFTRGVKGE